MTELEKKQSGEIYDARDPELRRQYHRAKNLAREYNMLLSEDAEGKERILAELVGGVGKNSRVNQPFYVDYGNNIHIGDNCLINMNCSLMDTGRITIGRNTLIGPDVKIYTAMHDKEPAGRFWDLGDGATAIKTYALPVAIGEYVWIGGGAMILPGVTIGNHAVIGAGSVVRDSIPDYAVACGNPCTVKYYCEEKKDEKNSI
ncbi:sugar O-acetyltransferase [Clostridium sp. MCC353]|uniref:sugar O-acetyltransferase n=1 Tax=Clostridium sp. MCC353 TaxID=2592646 RepID=UPI0020795C81|nr:sugar O-acetyltransferase [Clostridium sp. MCC353]MBT9779652.1 sugar O-acetyltransferase [Clostridium sp. MCC353]